MRRLYLVGFPLLMAFDTLAQLCFKYAGDPRCRSRPTAHGCCACCHSLGYTARCSVTSARSSLG